MIATGIAIGLHPTDDSNLTGSSGNLSIGFTVDDFEETKSFLQNLDIVITERNEEDGQFLHFAAPDATAIYFIKPKW